MSDVRVNFESALVEFRAAEQAYLRLVAAAGRLNHVGAYTGAVKARLQQVSDQIYAGEQQLYRLMQVALPAALMARIPAPFPLPVPPAEEPTDVSTAGLGAIPPPVIWAGLVLVVAAAALIGYLGAAMISSFYETIQTAIRARENGRRYEAQLIATQRRYETCLRSGGTPESCAATVPLPNPPLEQPPPGRSMLDWLLVGGAIAAVGWGGYYIYKTYRGGRRAAGALEGVAASPRVLPARGGGRRGRRSYQMQVR